MQLRRFVLFGSDHTWAPCFPRLSLLAYTRSAVSTGAPIYLVSACANGEEFVAAFRRYADKTGLFVPMAEPLPSGRKGRFAVTLRDGGVMLEGEAEIVSSAKTPSVLHGRAGMTIRFIEPDDTSKTVLVELERARLAMKPPAPSVSPRPAEIPAEPRPVVPVPAGRIDANNALAECVAIGDIATLAVVEAAPLKSGPKFVVPTIPPVAGARPATPTLPALPPRTITPSVPAIPPRPAKPVEPVASKPLEPKPAEPVAETTAPAPRPPETGPPEAPTVTADAHSTKSTQPVAVVPPPSKEPAGVKSDTLLAVKLPPETSSRISSTRPAVVVPPPARAVAVRDEDDDDPPVEPPPPAATLQRPDTIDIEANLALISGETGPLAAVTPADALPFNDTPVSMPAVEEPRPEPKKPAFIEAKTMQAAVAPMRPPAKPAPRNGEAAPPSSAPAARSFVDVNDLEISEPTDLTDMPVDPEMFASLSRRTTIGVAVVPDGVTVLPARAAPSEDDVRDTSLMEAQQLTAGIVGPRSIDGRAPTIPPYEVQEPTPSGDWTISTTTDEPTILPRASSSSDILTSATRPDAAGDGVGKSDPGVGLPTGDWTIALDSDSPDGWGEPAQVEKPARAATHPGPPMSEVASTEPLEARNEPERAIDDDGPKIQVDPTLIQPLQPMPLEEHSFTPMPVAAAPTADASGALPYAPRQMPPAVGMTPPGGGVPAYASEPRGEPGPAGYAAPIPFTPPPTATGARAFDPRDSAPQLPMPAADAGRRRRVLVIAISAALVLVVGAIVVIVLSQSGGSPSGGSSKPAPSGATGAVAPAPVSPVASARSVPPARTEPTPAAATTTPATCKIAVTTVPGGAELVVDGKVVATSDAAVELPCGVETKLVVRKQHHVAQTRNVTASTDTRPLKVTLAKQTFAVKISSKPPGATVTYRDRSLGVTPMITQLPAYESATLVFRKDGFARDKQEITPKTNNQAVQATLQRAARR